MRNRRREAVAEARLKVVFTAQEEGVSAAARKHGHARSTVQRRLRRWEQAGGDLRALCNRPRGNHEPLAPEGQEMIEQLKPERLGRSCEQIRELMEALGCPLSRQTVWRVLSERGLARVQETEPVRRFQHSQPNDLWQLDLGALGIRAAFAAPYKPRTKGKVERFFSFVQRHFLAEQRDRVRSLEELNQKLQEWREWYNYRRPHAGLLAGTPAQHYRPSRHPAPANLEGLLSVESPRRVARDSAISFRGQRLAVPPQYLGQRVWLQLLGDQLTITANNQTIARY